MQGSADRREKRALNTTPADESPERPQHLEFFPSPQEEDTLYAEPLETEGPEE
jgi:hypothetical protein